MGVELHKLVYVWPQEPPYIYSDEVGVLYESKFSFHFYTILARYFQA